MDDIYLQKLLPPNNLKLFESCPDLKLIWELPALQTDARESYEGWTTESSGEIFAIQRFWEILGIIGWFEYGDMPEVFRLRYFGMIPKYRGRGYGSQALKLLLQHLAVHAPPQSCWLAESVTLARTCASSVIDYFLAQGFEKFEDPSYGDNAGCGPTLSLRKRIPGRSTQPPTMK